MSQHVVFVESMLSKVQRKIKVVLVMIINQLSKMESYELN